MADPVVHIPLAGSWEASGSNRQYDQIGPQATLPGLGFIHRVFDRAMPFTRMMRAFRRLFGAGTDSLDGPVTLEVRDCGAVIVARGLECKRIEDHYEGEREVGGTIHKVRYDVVSPTEMVESWSFRVPKVEGIDAASRAKAEAMGFDMSILDTGFQAEHDANVRWRFTGDPEATQDGHIDCCKAVWLWWMHLVSARDTYRDADLIARATELGWDYTQLTNAVWAQTQLLKRARSPVPSVNEVMLHVQRVIDAIAWSVLTGEQAYQAAGSTSPSGAITVTRGRHPAIDRSILEHELVHSRQVEEYKEAWGPDDPGDTAEEGWIAYVTQPAAASAVEVEAYEATISVVADWLNEHCAEEGFTVGTEWPSP